MFSKPRYLELAVIHGPDTGRTRTLRDGTTFLGSSDTESDVTLRGLRIQPRHLHFEAAGAEVTLTNLAGGATLLQRAGDPGSVVTEPVVLHPGDTLQIGEETLATVRRSAVPVAKGTAPSGNGLAAMLGGNWPLLAAGGVLYLGVAVWWFVLREEPVRAAAFYLSDARIETYAEGALACAAAAPRLAAVPPAVLDLRRAPEGAWRVLVSDVAPESAREEAAAMLTAAVRRDLTAGESALRLEKWDQAKFLYTRIDARVPAPPLSRDGEARVARCELKRFVRGRLARFGTGEG